MSARVRCRSAACGAEFEIPRARLGRNIYCLVCGTRMTARPRELDSQLREREKRIGSRGGPGAPVTRLPLVALLDNVRSLWNVGSIFRTADACGVRRLLLTGITGCPPRPEIGKTALGAEQVVAWGYHADNREALERARSEGYTPVALETSGRAVPLDRMEWPERVCLVIGNEVAGVSQELLDRCTRQVCIPMRGIKDSLNVAVAFGIVAYHAARGLVESEARVQSES